MKTIGIAIVEHDGSYLVGMRPEGVPLAGYSEFPGGKCLEGERPDVCACRECREETGLDVASVRLLLNRVHEYPHGTVVLHFWLCRPVHFHEVAAEHRGFLWVSARELAALRFPDANAPVVEMLTRDR